MASKIQGITIRLDAEASSLDKALKDIESTSKGLNGELKQVNNLLKFDTKNPQLLAQKQNILSEAIETSSKKLDALKQAQGEVEKMFKDGDIGEKEYREFQRTIAQTEQSLKSYTTQMKRMEEEQAKLEKGNKQLNTFLEATGKSLDDFQDILGSRLTNALKDGTASSDDLTVALNKIGKEALGTEVDLQEMKKTLDKIDDGASIDEVSRDLQGMKTNSDEAEESMKELGKGVAAGNLMQAGEIIADVGQKIIDFSNNAKEAFKEVSEGADAIITATGATGELADGLDKVYRNIVSSLPTEDLLSVGQAIGEVNTQFGFVDDKLQNTSELMLKFAEITGSDVVASTQNAKQSISVFNLASDDLEMVLDSVAKTAQDTGVSVDTLFSNVISGAPNLQELGLSFTQSVKLLGNFEQAGVDSASALSSLSKAAVGYAADGKSLSEGLAETQRQILGAKDQTEALNIASEIFGTKGAVRMVDAIQRGVLNLEELGNAAEDSQGTVAQTFENTLHAIDEETVATNNIKLAMADMGNAISEAVAPILEALVPIIQKIADWFSNLSDTSRTIILVVGAVAAGIAVLAPILAVVAAAITTAGGAMAFLTGMLLPVAGVIAGIVAAIAGIVLLIKNWGEITEWVAEKWGDFKEWIERIGEGIGKSVSNAWNGIKDYFKNIWESISSEASDIWNGITGTIKNVWTGICEFFEMIWNAIYNVIEVPLNLIKAIIEGTMYAIYAIMYTIVEVIKAAWEWLSNTAIAIFEPILEFFKGIWEGIASAATMAWDTIKKLLSVTWDWIRTTAAVIFTPISKFFSDTWNGIKDTISNTWESIKKYLGDTWEGIKKEGVRIFKGLWDSIGFGFKDLKDSLGKLVADIANGIIKPFGSAINGVINGVNWILDKVGSKKQFDLWQIPKFARGAAGLPEDTIGVVNDQKGPVYKELIVPPKGKPFIAEGRDVVLPMKKGTKILPAKETKNFLDSLPHFANGIGSFFGNAWETIKNFTGSIWDYISEPGKIVQIAIDKFADLSGIVEPWLSVARGAVDTVYDSVVDFIKGIFDTEMSVNYNPSAGVEQWRSLAEKALRMTGQYSEANLTRLLYQMQTESGGNPNAINNWDINAKRGTPSKGLMQVIDPTFRAYAMPGYNTNIYDPLSNMLASIRYAVARYGNLAKAYRGVGYETGIGEISLSDLFAMPKLDISWFKDGGILTKPAAFQMSNGKWGGAGEKGAEVIAPTDRLKKYIQEAVLDVIGTKNIEINMNITQTMDGRVLAMQSGKYIQPVLDDMDSLKRMLRGER